MDNLNDPKREKYRFCRGCLTSSDNMKPIDSYRENFNLLTGVKIEQNDSDNWICAECHMLLIRFQNFKIQALKVDRILRECFDSSQGSFELKKSYIEDINNKKRLKSTILHVLSTCSECPVNKSLEKPKNVFVCDVVSQIGLKITNTENSCDLTEDSLANAFVYENNPIKSEKNCISEHEMSDNDKIDPHELSDGEYLDEQISSNKLKEKSKKKSKKESNLTISSLSKNVKKSSKTRKYKKHNWVEKTLRLRKSKVINLSIDEQMKELEDRKTSKDFHHAKYKCEFCVKVFPYSESLENHMLRHNESVGSFECKICHQRFKGKRILKNHLNTHSRRYQCLKCERILHFKKTMAHHLLRHENIYACHICDQLSKDKDTHREHQKTHTSTDRFKCSICPKVFKSKHDYGVHVRRHTGDMPFSCSECGKCFQTGGTLAAHKSVHSTLREFYCASCDISFKTREIMMAHLRRSPKHIDPALLKYLCSQCPKKFELEAQLEAHVKSYHMRVFELFCDLCPARFVSANGLRNHRRRKHEGLQPTLKHVCENCGRRFSTRATLTNHLRTHTGERPFECKTCHRFFTQKSSMQTHIKLVHLKQKRNRSEKSGDLNVTAESLQIKLCIDPIDI